MCMNHVVAHAAVIASLAGSALAQDVPPPAVPISPADLHGGSFVRTGYGPRYDATIYAIGTPNESGGGFTLGGTSVYDDVTFGNQGAQGPVVLSGIAFGVYVPITATPGSDHLYTRLSFYPNHNNEDPATAHPYSGTPVIWNLDIGSGWAVYPGPGWVGYYGVPVPMSPTVTLDATNVFTSPNDRTCGVYAELFLDAAMTTYAAGWQIMCRSDFGVPLIGSSDYLSWFGSSSNPAPDDITNADRRGTLLNPRAVYLKFEGTGYTTPPPPNSTPLGCIPDAGLVRAGDTVSVGHATWYSFCLPAGIQDATHTFLDIDTEGSQADVTMGLYRSDGVRVGIDYDSGSGLNALLSYGMGRRPAALDGRQYDGRHGQLSAGTYYLALAPVTQGPVTIRFSTNVDGTPIAPSVPPIINDDLDAAGPITSPGRQIQPMTLGTQDARWIRFTTCRPSSDQSQVTIDMSGTNAPGSAQTLFDSAGNVVSQSQSSSGVAPPMVFDSTDPLPAGMYYLAQSYADPQLAPNPGADGRWHLRPQLGPDGFTFAGTITVAWPSCPPPPCSADFNGDGDAGTDADIESFFACIGGNCCASCGSADFNNDGDTGTDADIESFFRVLAGGPC
jgi:hypothetical protein